MATSAYQAAADSNDLEMSYAPEVTWGTVPNANFQKFRVNSEGFSETRNRTRPPEIRSDGQAAAAVTQDVNSSGNIAFGVSFGNVDALWAGAFNGVWSTPLNISANNVIADNGDSQFQAAATTFNSVQVGQWVKVEGFETAGANGYFRVTAKAGDGSTITVSPAPADDAETGNGPITFKGTMLRNGTTFTSFSIQKRLGANLGFVYPGVYFTGGQLNARRGDFFSGTLDAICKGEEKAAAAVGSGFTAAPTNKVMNTVSNLKSLSLDGGALAAKIMSVNANFRKEGAAGQFAIGDEAAVGITKGTFTADLEMEVFFNDYALYDAYKDEDEISISYRVEDAAGNCYIVTYPVVVLGTSNIVVGGPNQPVMARFQASADPDPVTGCTMQLDAFQAA